MFAKKGDDWVRWIAVFKLVKGLLFFLVGLGFTAFFEKEMAEQVMGWMRLPWLRQENRDIGLLLSWAMGFSRRDVGVLEASIFVYAALLLAEGVGLLLLKRWAEYLTVVTTAAFIPLEAWSDVRHFGLIKTVILFLNVLAVWYLSARLWTNRQELRLRAS
jgi:uncharacterized membrane protein (DUF2068 family)